MNLDHLEALLAKATGGFWFRRESRRRGHSDINSDLYGGTTVAGFYHRLCNDDADAIAALINAAPELLAAARERDRLREEVQAALSAACAGHRNGDPCGGLGFTASEMETLHNALAKALNPEPDREA